MFDSIEQELNLLYHTRAVWDIIWALRSAPHLPNEWQIDHYLLRTYVSTVCSGVRREVDADKKTNSLRRNLEYLKSNRVSFTRNQFTQRFRDPGSLEEVKLLAHEAFLAFAPNGSDHVEEAVINESIRRLTAVVEPVTTYTNKVVAHRAQDMSFNTSRFSLAQIDHAMDELEAVFKQYYRLRHPGESLGTLTPLTNPGWQLVFQDPWLPKGSSPPTVPNRSGFIEP